MFQDAAPVSNCVCARMCVCACVRLKSFVWLSEEAYCVSFKSLKEQMKSDLSGQNVLIHGAGQEILL